MAYTDDESGPRGVGGWMVLFLFGFAFFSPISLVFGTYRNIYAAPGLDTLLGDNWVPYQIFEWSLVVMALVLIAAVVWRLFNVQTPATVRLTVAAIPILAFGILLLDIVGSLALIDIDPNLLFEGVGPDMLRGAAYTAIWCTYFLVSKRVRNTYYGLADTEAAEVFE